MVYIPDTGPLWTFAVVGELDLLGTRLVNNVEWTTAVQEEVARNAIRDTRLAPILTQSWLPPPVDLSAIGLDGEAFRIRATIAGAGDHPREHLGEAEAIAYAKHVGGATFITQDEGAFERAGFDQVHCVRVTDVLQDLVAFGEITRDKAWEIYVAMVAEGRLKPDLVRPDVMRW